MNLAELFAQQAAARGRQIAFVDDRGGRLARLGFADLERESARVAQVLQHSGLGCGMRVVLMLPMCVELYVSLLALLRLGISAIVFDPAAPARAINGAVRGLAPDGIIAGRRTLLYVCARFGAVRAIRRRIVLGCGLPFTTNWHQWLAGGPVQRAIASVAPDHPALITLTTGATGAPKIAVRSHAFLAAQYRALTGTFPYVAGTTELTTLPMFALASLAAGITNVIPAVDLRRPGAIDGRVLLDQIERHAPDRIIVPPALLRRIFAHCAKRGSPMRGTPAVLTGGGPVFPDLVEVAARCLPDGHLHIVYGSTEAEPIATIAAHDITPADLADMRRGRGLLVGRPVTGIDCRIVPEPGGRNGKFANRPFTAGTAPGEIEVAGAHVLRDYFEPTASAAQAVGASVARWHRTGDAGFFDADRRLWLLGRCSANAGGIYPFEIEPIVRALHGVTRAAVCSVGGRRCLAIQFDPGLPADERAARLRDLTKLPIDHVSALRRIPLDARHNSKIDYPRLRRMLGGTTGCAPPRTMVVT